MSIFIRQITVPKAPLIPNYRQKGLILFPFSDPAKFMDLQRAIAVAEEVHRGRKRADGSPFVMHPLAVLRILAEASTSLPFRAYLTAVLHDTLEVERHIYPRLLEEFGGETAEMVWALTKPIKTKFCQGGEREQLYISQMQRIQSTHPEIMLVKMADRIHNVETSRALEPERRKKMLMQTATLYLPLFERASSIAPDNLKSASGLLLLGLEQSIVRQRIAINL
jgi:guanosine-3',5'-bis(diphosphate) 3'-pyrophosphohydrolase